MERWIGIWTPFLDATEAGLWLFFVLERQVVAVPRPALRITEDELHCGDGPAVAWPGGARYWFWRGVQVPQKVIEAPATLNTREILAERNVEVRRVMLERFGFDKFIRRSGASLIDDDVDGLGNVRKLWAIEIPGDEPLVMVEVMNSTAEEDGSLKSYMLRVPPTVRSTQEAVAWSFDVPESLYAPAVET